MSRSDRLLDLVQLLGGRRSRSLKEIVRHFEVSERTAYRDLAALERRRIPLTRDEHGYRLVEGATLRPLRLTGEERALLRLRALDLLVAEDGVPGYRLVRFSAAAKEAWVAWWDAHAAEMASPELPAELLGPWGKLKSYAARLALVDGTRIVLRNVLTILGVTAPERLERKAEGT